MRAGTPGSSRARPPRVAIAASRSRPARVALLQARPRRPPLSACCCASSTAGRAGSRPSRRAARPVGAIDLSPHRAVWAAQQTRSADYEAKPSGPARIVSRRAVTGAELGARLRERDLSAAPAALNLIENRTPAAREQVAALLAEVSPARLGGEAPAHVVGVTGPPGAGKSTLLSALARAWREDGRTVAVLAVDPTSKRSGGSLLGDRARIEADPADRGLFIRSTAAGERLGGLAPATRAAAQALAAAFDVVVIETVGVGQSETEVAEAADTTAVVVQPGSGDALQFLKAGIMEVPDVLVVTKADLGQVALRARRDLSAALRSLGERETAVVAVSSLPPAVRDRGARGRARRAPRRARRGRRPHPRAAARRARGLRRRARRARPARARRPPRRREGARRAGPGARAARAAGPARGARRIGSAPCARCRCSSPPCSCSRRAPPPRR